MSENMQNDQIEDEKQPETNNDQQMDEQKKLVEQIAKLEQELETAKKNESEAMLRARAEIDNFRRRLEQDVDKARRFALEKFSLELLPVIDNLERAIELTDRNNPEIKPMLEGVELTLKSLLDTVNKFGITVIKEINVDFNPNLHEAMSIIDSPEHQSNQIIDMIQKGYTLNGRLLRPAMVIVSK